MPQQEHQNTPDDYSPDPSSVITSFDELAKGLATGAVSRGTALRWMGGALLGAALAAVPGVAWADDRCSEEQSRCGVRCVNLQTNERHCGSCFNRCAEGQECVGGVCQCPSGTTLCGGNCVPNCPSGQTLNTSTCQCVQVCPPDCPPGQACVDGQCAICPIGQYQTCCSCSYTTGPDNPVLRTCAGPVVGPDVSTCAQTCFQYCVDNTPPGAQLQGTSQACLQPQDRIQRLLLCRPTTEPGEIGTRCNADFTCTPAG
jgi:Stigma-specific protein, Stig1